MEFLLPNSETPCQLSAEFIMSLKSAIGSLNFPLIVNGRMNTKPLHSSLPRVSSESEKLFQQLQEFYR